ncbi:BCCT family transporter [Kordiimonas sp. SCSIO 12610]|uniref:BCCT family transporter n=1 Tax=Kordiimonas sp. SCSIO 12610 TaxID=2829597 RepID=UPI002109F3D5|nr:BCCT family transporter [Kordiimonas sp. SCSIO 12610]UTW54677.1 BCCT family transporter [Kordiimonas sp. SCSIO 12610]
MTVQDDKQDDFDLPDHVAPEESSYDTDYEAGQDNIEVLGLDIHNPVFAISAVTILIFVFGTLVFPEAASSAMNSARSWVLGNFDWFFVSTTNLVFLFCFIVAVSPLGRIRLGGSDARPEFSTKSWLSMLFSAGVGIGMVFYGAAEPVAYYTAWSGSPLEAEPLTSEAKQLAFSATIFHWGITPWAIYAVVGLALAFFSFNKGLPLTIRSAFYPLFGERIWGWPGHLIDLLAVVATLFGLATSLGLGAKQAAGGLNFLFGVDASLNTQIILIIGITGLAIISVVRGLDGGVKLLSNINMLLAIIFLIFVVAVGPTFKIFEGFFTNAVNYIADTPKLSNWLGRDDKDWFHGWTIFYWAWWVSWSPFVGMFIARVSKGRTIREFMAAVLVVPVFVAIIWFTSFGVTALEQIDNNVGSLPQGITDVSLVLFQMLENLPFAQFSSLVAIVLLVVFFVTSSDSGSLVIDSITAGGKLHAPTVQRVFWAVLQGLVAIVLLIGGGSAALSSLQAGTIAAGLPFALVLLVCCVSLYRGLMTEYVPSKHNK